MTSDTCHSYASTVNWLGLMKKEIIQMFLWFPSLLKLMKLRHWAGPAQSFCRWKSPDLSDFAALSTLPLPHSASPPSLLPRSPPPPWQGSHAACASTQDVLPEVPGPDGPRKLLLINHQALQSCAQPLSPLNLPRSRCVGPICPLSRTGSSSPRSKSVVPSPPGPGATEQIPGSWWGDSRSIFEMGRGQGEQCLKLCP